MDYNPPVRRRDGIGRRTGLKIQRWQHRTGSTPVAGTREKPDLYIVQIGLF